MRHELIPLTAVSTRENPIELDDYLNNSEAIYLAYNLNHKYCIYYKPDEYDVIGPDGKEPRCDYLLISSGTGFEPRFIELKGGNWERGGCCKTEWSHAFHQLFCTYKAYEGCKDSPDESVIFILCTSTRKKQNARIESYRWYKKLRELTAKKPMILYDGDYDEL